MYMRKWTFCQFEWYRDNKKLLPSQALAWGGFLFQRTGITAFFLADRMPEAGIYFR
ncbi:hypothetical protein F170042I7_19520 [Blautia caecimuris]